MCGITGFSLSRYKEVSIENMLFTVKHRGPDDQGSFISEDRHTGVGQVRLSIIDLTSSGHQPMFDSTGRYAIVLNGEIYNYSDLKKEITEKYGFHAWSSKTDTEVIIEGYAREGRSFIERLNGIFALSIFDKNGDSLLLARDPMGVKPLYYTEQNGDLYFSSEMKTFLKVKDLRRTLRQESLADQLAFMYVPEPYTMFQEFLKLVPGEYRVYKKGTCTSHGLLHWEGYFESSRKIGHMTQQDMIEKFRQCFNDAVKRQLMADVPVSLFLSGGLDSSAVLAATVEHGGVIHDAYTISFSKDDMKYDGQSDDLYYARKVSDKFGVKLHVIEASPDMLSLLPEVVFHLDDALADPAAINTYLICKAARENGVKVMLSGQGADELFGGYRRYYAETIYRILPGWVKKAADLATLIVPTTIAGTINAPVRRLQKFLSTVGAKDEERTVGLSMWTKPDIIKDLFIKPIMPGTRHKEAWRTILEKDPIKKMMRLDQQIYMTSHNLMYTDKMSMMAGVEARVPFLDLQMTAFARSLPLSMMLKGTRQKYILKKAMEGVLPHEVIYRSKAGFGSPIRAWFREENEQMKMYFDKRRLTNQGIFKTDAVNYLVQENISSKKDNSYTLFALLNFQIWWDIFVEGKQTYS